MFFCFIYKSVVEVFRLLEKVILIFLLIGIFCKIVVLLVIVNFNDINIGIENGWFERIYMFVIVVFF